jgi:thioredoxin-related protein
MAPIVHGLEADYNGRIHFFFLDADDPATLDLRRQFGFRVQPEVYLLDGEGKLVKAWFGYVSRDQFEGEFGKLLGN